MLEEKVSFLKQYRKFDMQPVFISKQPLTPPLLAQEGEKVISPDRLLDLPFALDNFSSLKWLNDSQIIFSSPRDSNKKTKTIDVIDLESGDCKVIQEGSNPRPSPDGRWIIFARGEKDEKQLFIMCSDGSEVHQLLHVEGGLHDEYFYSFDWSPDSKRVAFACQPQPLERGNEGPLQSQLKIINLNGFEVEEIRTFEGRIDQISWLPDGQQLLITKERVGFLYNEAEDFEWIQLLNVETGGLKTLLEFHGLQQFLRPVISPDGKSAIMTYDPDNPSFDCIRSLGVFPLDGDPRENPIKRLTHDMQVFSPRWSCDGQSIYFKRSLGAYSQIYKLDLTTQECSQITNVPSTIESYEISPDGHQIAWIGKNTHDVRTLSVSSILGQDVRDVLIVSSLAEGFKLSEVREVEWKSPGYPYLMRGLLIFPARYEKGQLYPLIVDIHGGGSGAKIYLAGGILNSTALEWQMWAANGYAVFVPEFRSSGSFGPFLNPDFPLESDLVDCDINDIEAGIDELIQKKIIDPERLGVIGHSAGARRANWLLATRHQFRAAVSKEGWADEWIQFMSDLPINRVYEAFGGAPWEVPENYFKNSALYHCQGAATPTLFLMGNPKLGGADPYYTVKMLHNALKSQGVPTQYVEYLDEGHNFEKPKNQKDALERAINWMDLYLRSETVK